MQVITISTYKIMSEWLSGDWIDSYCEEYPLHYCQPDGSLYDIAVQRQETNLVELTKSIKKNGFVVPVAAWAASRIFLIDGHNRLSIAHNLGLEIPVAIFDKNDAKWPIDLIAKDSGRYTGLDPSLQLVYSLQYGWKSAANAGTPPL